MLLLITSALLLGHLQPAPDWAAQVTCTQPCWAGLNPDVTGTTAKVTRALQAQPQLTVQSSNGGGGFEISIGARRYEFVLAIEMGQDMAVYHLVPGESIPLGEVLLTFGTPDNFYYYEICPNTRACSRSLFLRFPQQRVEAIFPVDDHQKLWAGSSLTQLVFGRLAANLRQGCEWRGIAQLAPQPECRFSYR